MPRIRKKTSNRTTTHQRAKLKHKISEGRKKNKKEAKKNPQWKSKKKKDPGIPNDFPYKDQILAEVADTRRQAEEAKRLRKEEKKAAREGLLVQDDNEENAPAAVEESSSSTPQSKEAPQLLNPDFPNLKGVLDKAHVVLHVLDARDPLSFRLPHIEDVVSANEKSKLVFVLNKIDLVPRESLAAWAKQLRAQHPTFFFRSASAFLPKSPMNDPNAKGKAKESPADAIGTDALLDYLTQQAEEVQSDTLQVAVVGVTNTGKSAIINSLARKAAVSIYTPTPSTDAWSTTTTRAYEVSIAPKNITLVDTPGVSLHNETAHDDALKIRDMLLRCRGRVDKLKDPVPAVEHIVSRADTTDLMVHYTLPAFAAGDTTAFLAGVARAHALLKKGGVPDAAQAARVVLRDWTTGRLPFYADTDVGEITPSASNGDTDAMLDAVRTRKEMRRGGGLVRLRPGEAEKRRVQLETLFLGDELVEESSGSGDEDEGEGEDDDEEEDEDDEEEGSDDDDDDDASEIGKDAPVAPSRGKRKRTAVVAKTGPPAKKVAFAAGTQDPQERKAARAASKPGKSPPKAALKNTKKDKKSLKPTKKDGNTPKDAKKDTNTTKKPTIPPPKNPPPQSTDTDAYDFGQFFK